MHPLQVGPGAPGGDSTGAGPQRGGIHQHPAPCDVCVATSFVCRDGLLYRLARGDRLCVLAEDAAGWVLRSRNYARPGVPLSVMARPAGGGGWQGRHLHVCQRVKAKHQLHRRPADPRACAQTTRGLYQPLSRAVRRQIWPPLFAGAPRPFDRARVAGSDLQNSYRQDGHAQLRRVGLR